MNRRLILTAGVAAAILVAVAVVVLVSLPRTPASAASSPVTAATTFAIPGADRPHDMAVDRAEHAVWVSSVQPQPGNRLFRLDTQQGIVASWSLPGQGTWAGGPLCATADAVWIGIGPDLIRFDKKSATVKTFPIPAPTRMVPADHIPSDPVFGTPKLFGVAGITAGGNGRIWLSRVYVNSLLEFVPETGSFVDHPLPALFGAPDELTVESDGRIWMTEGISGDPLGSNPVPLIADKTAVYSPDSDVASVYPQPSGGIVATGKGPLVIGSGQRVLQIDQNTGAATAFPGFSKFRLHTAIAWSDGRLFAPQSGEIDEVGGDGSIDARFSLPQKEIVGGHVMKPDANTQPPPASPVFAESSVSRMGTDADGVVWALIDNFSLVARCAP